ncbi:Receptor-type tyrosine-protein phosphatase mu [Nymphon striatum]|nr:Receptor-type tyrosine-protein phosphatase mu [Nymphon striatum]
MFIQPEYLCEMIKYHIIDDIYNDKVNDETRVILKKINNDEFSDYINANYISGYDLSKKTYIATQGPKKNTFYDFWRMIWDDNCRLILMLTNLIENGREKCDEYWPEISGQFRDIHIRFVGVKVQAEYTIRTFQISRNSGPRLVRHFHFTGWPDHAAPMYSTTLVSMLNEVERFNSPDYGPMVVHCSAGVGRTGTIIMIDAMLKMANECKRVDFLRFLHQMRCERVNMVENEMQYIFAHEALLEALYGAGTCISCDIFSKQLEKLKIKTENERFSPIQQQFKNLNKLTPRLSPEDCRTGLLSTNENKNRCANILPRKIGYKKKDSFILTQMPLPQTVDDFWVCVYDNNASAIVLLNEFPQNDQTCKPYWPQKRSWICGKISVEMIAEEHENAYYILRTFMICNSTKATEKPRTVKQFHFRNWNTGELVPPSTNNFIELMEEVRRWQQQSGNNIMITQCFDGTTASGVFAASMFLCDKIKEEQNVDVFISVRNVRSNRPQCIKTEVSHLFFYSYSHCFSALFAQPYAKKTTLNK